MTLEEQINEQENMILKAMKENRSCSIIYKMFEIYEDLYAEIKRPTQKQESDYITLYFKYEMYIRKN